MSLNNSKKILEIVSIPKIGLAFLFIFYLWDYNIFVSHFGFDLGTFNLLLKGFSFFEFNTIYYVFLIVPAILFMFFFSIYLMTIFSYPLFKLYNSFSFTKFFVILVSCLSIFAIFFIEIIMNYLISNNYVKDSFYIYLIYLLLIIIITIHIKYLINEVLNGEGYKLTIGIIVLVLTFTLILLFIGDTNVKISNFIVFFNILLIAFSIFVSSIIDDLIRTNQNNKKKCTSHCIFIIIVAIFLIVYLFFSKNNYDVWSKKISSKDLSVNHITSNLIFNKGFLISNSLDINVKIPNKYYRELIKQLKNCEYKNISQICIDNELQDYHMYTIGDKYYYLELSSNIKIYFKNLFIGEEFDNKFIGYQIFIIEEKKFANREGSEYILISAKTKFFEDFSFRFKNFENYVDWDDKIKLNLLSYNKDQYLFAYGEGNDTKNAIIDKNKNEFLNVEISHVSDKFNDINKNRFSKLENYFVKCQDENKKDLIRLLNFYYLPYVELNNGILIYNNEKQNDFYKIMTGN